jgi:hypothetical protein
MSIDVIVLDRDTAKISLLKKNVNIKEENKILMRRLKQVENATKEGFFRKALNSMMLTVRRCTSLFQAAAS